ncbi:molybdopterin dinucleotide binding domain-containing protein, partial [Nocardia sp. NPDC004722]
MRALVGFGSNLLLSQPDSARTAEALRALEFQVHIDLFDNPTAAYADIVLPAGSAWEREALRIGFEVDHRAQQHVQLRPRVVDPVGLCRSDTEIVFDLATRMGMGELFFDGDIEAGWNHQLRPRGLTVADLRARPGGVTVELPRHHRKYRTTGFATPTRRVELYSEQLAAHGYSPVPCFHPPVAPTPAFPLVLTCAKNGYFVHSQHRQISALRRRSPDPRIDLSPAAAAERGITDGQWVRVRTRNGGVRLRARLDESLHPGVVIAEYGWWQADPDLGLAGHDPLSADGSNVNLLVDDEDIDPISGSIPLRSFTCQVSAEPAEQSWQGTRTFLVASAETVGRDVRALRLVPADGGPMPDYLAGQHLTVRTTLPGSEQPTERRYSLIGPERQADRDGYRLAVRRIPQGRFSGYVHDTLEVLDRVEISAPAGQFVIPADLDNPVVMLAGGIGITPFLSYLETVAATGTTAPALVLHYGVANSADHPFRERLRLHHCVGRPLSACPDTDTRDPAQQAKS